VPDTRELVVTDLPYVVVYRVTLAEVQILRVLHTRQDFQ
jgi:plasmid stabilization system protein ParE